MSSRMPLGRAPCLLVLLLAACSHSGAAERTPEIVGALAFVGTTPCGVWVREFLGGLESTAACHSITWRLTLATEQETPTRYELAATYGVPTRSNPNLTEEGPSVTLRGAWSAVEDAKSDPRTKVYKVEGGNDGRAMSFVEIGDDLLHWLDDDGNLRLADGAFSYTLNRAARAEEPAGPARERLFFLDKTMRCSWGMPTLATR